MNALEYEFYELGEVWHLCTPGDNQCLIFRDRDDYVYGMNLIALAAYKFKDQLKILTFQIMSNHLHFVLACNEQCLREFFMFFRKRLRRYLANLMRASDLDKFSYNVFKVSDLKYLQTLITYVNRNGYLIDSNSTPFTYEWGPNRYFFNELYKCNERSVQLHKIGSGVKRQMFKSRNFEVSEEYSAISGYVTPLSYCAVKLVESFYRDANHYFYFSSRQVESYTHIARELGDVISYTDEEMHSIVYGIINKKYDIKNPVLLGKNEKIEVAKIMKFQYNASNKQIKRILKLESHLLDTLFPYSAHQGVKGAE